MSETLELLQVIRCFFSCRRDSMQNLSINPNSVNKNLAHHDSSLTLLFDPYKKKEQFYRETSKIVVTLHHKTLMIIVRCTIYRIFFF